MGCVRGLVWKLQVRQCCPLLFGEKMEGGGGRRRIIIIKMRQGTEHELETNFFKSSKSWLWWLFACSQQGWTNADKYIVVGLLALSLSHGQFRLSTVQKKNFLEFQITLAEKFCNFDPLMFVGPFKTEFAACHNSGAKNFELEQR